MAETDHETSELTCQIWDLKALAKQNEERYQTDIEQALEKVE